MRVLMAYPSRFAHTRTRGYVYQCVRYLCWNGNSAFAVPVATSQCITERDAEAVWFAFVQRGSFYIGRRNAALYYSATMPMAMHCLDRALPPAVDGPANSALSTYTGSECNKPVRSRSIKPVRAVNEVNELVGGARFQA